MPLITCKDVSIGYEGNIVISEVNFSVVAGSYLCIVGENGSGKSTLLKAILGLKQPCKGSIIMREDLKPNEIGYLPQQTSIQKDFPASVYEVVISGCLNSRGFKIFYGKKEKDKAMKNIRLLGIGHIINKCYRDLSGGQQQRVLLARALCATKKILLLDEPLAGLDPLVTKEMYGIIKKLNKELGITIIMISHDIKSAVENADYILHLHKTCLFFGKTTEYRKSECGEHFLGGDIDD